MVQRVLVAVDGTEASGKALEVACGLADKYEAALGLVAVVEPDEVEDDLIRAAETEGVIAQSKAYTNLYSADFGAYTSSSVYRDMAKSQRAVRVATILAEATANSAKAQAADKPFKAVETFIASGDPAKAILKCAKQNAADVIIMGHDEPKWYKAPFRKSVAKTVVRGATCPVLVYSSPDKK
ncbi:MAG: universal stress protein [Dinoroseobacter sp.]|nr:universal stress protein [Dinoroseobacter sp.]